MSCEGARMSCDSDSFCKESESKRRSSSIPRVSEDGSPFENLFCFYIFVRLLGSGAFGIVNLMQDRTSGQFYAVKIVKKKGSNADSKILYEITLGMRLNSPYVCKVHDFHEDDRHFYIIMEYLQGMELCVFIQKNPKFFRENPKYFWIVVESILQALAYLYSQGIAHFDVKPENIIILFDTEGNILGAKLIDLGLSMEVNETTKCFRGTSAYMAPECFDKFLSTGFPADIWSFGMTLYAMLMASLPIYSKNKDPQHAQEDIYRKIENLLRFEKIIPFPKMSECEKIFQIEKFITSCFIVNPTNRPTATQLMDNILSTD